MENYRSATDESIRDRVEAQIKEEIHNGRYLVVPNKPHIVSALGAIEKKNKKIRLIHDASRPHGNALNDLWEKEPFSYTSLQDAIDNIKPKYFLAKVDLSNAFRSVKVNPQCHTYTGLKWYFRGDCNSTSNHPTYMVDTRLPFGARRSPYIFNKLTQAVCDMMAAKGFPGCKAYLDDFIVIQPSESECRQALTLLMQLLRKLGFAINYSKVEGPVQRIVFLGITLDTNKMTVSLPDEKLKDLYNNLNAVNIRNKVTKRELQCLTGRLNFATQCIYGGRFFLRRLNDAIAKLSKPHHRTRITLEMRKDISWWRKFLEGFNGTTCMVESRPSTPVYTDACPVACGCVYGDQFVYLPWCYWPEISDLHINFQETAALEVALRFWGPTLANTKIIWHCDNQAAVGIVRKSSSTNPIIMECLRRIFWLSVSYNFRLYPVYHPGSLNALADGVSRLHEGDHHLRALNLCPVVLQRGELEVRAVNM